MLSDAAKKKVEDITRDVRERTGEKTSESYVMDFILRTANRKRLAAQLSEGAK